MDRVFDQNRDTLSSRYSSRDGAGVHIMMRRYERHNVSIPGLSKTFDSDDMLSLM